MPSVVGEVRRDAWCNPCYNAIQGYVNVEGQQFPKQQLVKKKNDDDLEDLGCSAITVKTGTTKSVSSTAEERGWFSTIHVSELYSLTVGQGRSQSHSRTSVFPVTSERASEDEDVSVFGGAPSGDSRRRAKSARSSSACP